jgi:glycosyltransferase involved in cell wall biosynthesis
VVTGFLAEHPADVFHCHVGTGSEDWDGVRLARAAGCRAVVQTQHLPYFVAHPRKRSAYHHAIEGVDRLIAVSDGVRRTYLRIGVPAGRITTVANGIAAPPVRASREQARHALGLGPDEQVVLTVGRLTHMKEQWQLIDAVPLLAARFPRLAVVLIGDGPLRRSLTDRAAALGVASLVRFPGHRPDAPSLLPAADVFALPSRREGMPLAALEAMAAGLPVVATRVIGSEEVVVDGVTGALVPRGAPAALAGAIADLLADPELRRRQGLAGRRHQQAHFTRERMAADTLAVYESARVADRSVLEGSGR